MAIVKNWMREAAVEIAGNGTKYWDDRLIDQAVDVILKHCPMKPDTAYMEVPRCETCRHFLPWKRLSAREPLESIRGDCQLFLGKLNGIRNDFGCVQWEAKR